ncbi:MAG: T9SS type A sorting domain-containing protein [Muribaculaceae bacterium]|nr:T9SS type A sorting domain-containing protein [Muribaculaceae bacterium]
MKDFYLIPTLVFFLSVSLLSNAETLTAEYQSQSPCKDHSRSFEEDEFNETRCQFILSYENKTLTFFGKNLYENCGSVIDTEASMPETKVIHFKINATLEDEFAPDCMCRYDIEASFNNIEPGSYTIYINDEQYPVVELSEGSFFNLTELSGIEEYRAEHNSSLSIIDNNVLKVTATDRTEVTVYDTEGRLRMRLFVDGDSEISLATLPEGMYMIKATNRNSINSIKYLKK